MSNPIRFLALLLLFGSGACRCWSETDRFAGKVRFFAEESLNLEDGQPHHLEVVVFELGEADEQRFLEAEQRALWESTFGKPLLPDVPGGKAEIVFAGADGREVGFRIGCTTKSLGVFGKYLATLRPGGDRVVLDVRDLGRNRVHLGESGLFLEQIPAEAR